MESESNVASDKVTANSGLESFVNHDLFEYIWPEYCTDVVTYAEFLLSGRVNSLGFSIHGPSGSGKTVFAKHIGGFGSAVVHYLSGLDLSYAYGRFLDSPLKRFLVSAPKGKPIVFVIDDADVLVTGKGSIGRTSMCWFMEELDLLRQLKQPTLFIIITQDENQLHPVLRRDEYFPHSFCIPPLSRENIRYILSYLLSKLDDPTVSSVVMAHLDQKTEDMIPEWNGCTLGHIAYLLTIFLQNIANEERRDGESITKRWQQSLETTFFVAVQKNPEILLNKQPRNSTVDLSWDDESTLSEAFKDLATVIEYSVKQTDNVFPCTVSPFRGALVYGPCGVGKTSLCLAVIQKLGLPVFVVDGASLLASAIGQSEKTLKQCFVNARRVSPSIIFVDQIDMVFQKRDFADGTSAESLSRLTALFLSEMDGFSTSRRPDLFVLATAQNVDKIDPALLRPGRLEYKRMLDFPTSHQRYQYVCDFIKRAKEVGIALDEEFEDDSIVDWVVKRTHMWSLADLSMLSRSVLLCCWRDCIHSDIIKLKRAHIEQALNQNASDMVEEEETTT